MFELIAIVGKSGAGKTTLYKDYLKQTPNAKGIISCTTRPPREDELDGVDYYFLSNEEFLYKVEHNLMLEYTCFNGWYYGTEKDKLSSTLINVGVFNPSGIASLKKHQDINLHIVYVKAKDEVRLKRQIERENNPNMSEIVRRFNADGIDFSDFEEEDCEIIVDTTFSRPNLVNLLNIKH